MKRPAIAHVVPALAFACALAQPPVATEARQQAARDSGAPLATGTAIVAGSVETDEAVPRPIRRAVVTITGTGLGAGRSAVTDEDGLFEIRDLPAGQVIITATKHTSVTAVYGATRPGRPATPVTLAAGQSVRVTLRMGRAAVATGAITDGSGDPLPDIRLFALNARDPRASVQPSLGRGRVTPMAMTDDRGVYRFFDLVPGEYIVVAFSAGSLSSQPLAMPSSAELDAALSALRSRARSGPGGVGTGRGTSSAPPAPRHVNAPVFYPGTSRRSEASRVRLAAGEERRGIDFVMTSVPVATIEGSVANAVGPLPAGIQLGIESDADVGGFYLSRAIPTLSQRPDLIGRFKYTNVIPGHYRITARGTSNAPPTGGRGSSLGAQPANPSVAGDVLYGLAEIDVNGQDIFGVTILLQPGSRVSGRVLIDPAPSTAPADLSQFSFTISGTGGTLRPLAAQADGTIDFGRVGPGAHRIQYVAVPGVGARWWLRSAMSGDRDLLDTPLETTPGGADVSLVLTMTDRQSELSGKLRTVADLGMSEYDVIVFPADRSLWRADSRRVKSARPATDGTFSFSNLPAGEYRLVAVADADPDEWQRTEFLARVATLGVLVIVKDGEKTVQDFQIRGGG